MDFRRGGGAEIDESPGVFGTGKRLAEAHEAEAVVDALLKDAAQALLALHQARPRAFRRCGDGRGQTRGTSAQDDDVVVLPR